jgi:alginate O-acetyltransferase complex protein AlgI
MVFSSAIFLFYFLPAFLFLYYVLPWKNGVLLAGSLLFYAWGEPRFVPLLVLSAFINYSFGYLIERAGPSRKLLLGIGVGTNLALLAYYKYLGFFTHVYNQLLARHVDLPVIVLPLGISFFTFQGLSYLIDVYRGDVSAQKSFLKFATYKAMFPQLIAGPIVRYRQISSEIGHRDISNSRVWLGCRQFVVGLVQKVMIANTVALPADNLFLAGPDQLTAASAWIAVACYSIQILYDFAGYSNMAIGIGHMLGFTYPRNFDRPYSSASVTEFWRRWHMSLSSWFRDYVYIPLGGNRGAPWRTYLNLSIVFLLCGLWHGAAWTFVIWGAWHGFLLVLERAGLGAALKRLPAVVGQLYTLVMVMLGWVFFRANDVPTALKFIRTMFGGGKLDIATHPWQVDVGPAQWTALLLGAAFATWRLSSSQPDALPTPAARAPAARWLQWPVLLGAYVLCTASIAAGTYNPFIYFRF